MRHSLIIATLEDNGDLAHLLASLAALASPDRFEVIIVDQNGDGRLVELVSSYSGILDIVHERVDFRGVSRARNWGARKARGAWLSFPDDDCRYLWDTLARVEEVIATDSEIAVVTGRTLDDAGNAVMNRWPERRLIFSRWSMFACGTEAALFVASDLFRAVGGFDEEFGLGGSYAATEGFELMERLFAAMGPNRACFDPAIVLLHPAKFPPWNRAIVKRFFASARGDGAFIAKHLRLHALFWGARRMASSVFETVYFRGWQSIAHAAYAVGLISGFVAYAVRRGKPRQVPDQATPAGN